MSLLLFLNFGIYQFYYDFSAMRQTESETPLLIASLLIALDVFSAAAAIWAFLGENLARILLLIFISLNMLWSIFVLILNISYAKPNPSGFYDADIFLFGLSLIKPLFLFGLGWWYFTQRNVIAYYKQENNNEFF
ncbi:MAG: hypothetical protein ABI891_16075 [Acidobacteriota bacterium]